MITIIILVSKAYLDNTLHNNYMALMHLKAMLEESEKLLRQLWKCYQLLKYMRLINISNISNW